MGGAAALIAERIIEMSVLAYEDLGTEVDTRFLGTQSVGWVLTFITYHTLIHTGEISAVKGMQGLKGLPF